MVDGSLQDAKLRLEHATESRFRKPGVVSVQEAVVGEVKAEQAEGSSTQVSVVTRLYSRVIIFDDLGEPMRVSGCKRQAAEFQGSEKLVRLEEAAPVVVEGIGLDIRRLGCKVLANKHSSQLLGRAFKIHVATTN